jgi:hypothetical protein
VGSKTEKSVDAWKSVGGADVHDQSFDMVVMNPPFTRLTGGGGKSEEVSRPLFAAFGTTADEQAAMSKKASKLLHSTSYHGNAGAASAFVEIGHRKLKVGGRFGYVLPVSAMSGASWEACRSLWRKNYSDVLALTIAAERAGTSAFSADTGVGECVIVGTRSTVPDGRMVGVTLYRKPHSNLEGVEIARRVKQMKSSGAVKNLEDGPFGGTDITIGDEKIGEALACSITSEPWPLYRIRDHSIAQTAYQLASKTVWVPGSTGPNLTGAQICRLSELGVPGPYHLDVSGSAISGGAPRGPFKIEKTKKSAAASFPILASHQESRERYLEIEPDSQGKLRHASDERGEEKISSRRDYIWGTRTRLHFSTDARFNSNGLIACVTTRECIGGRAWPSFILNEKRYEKMMAVWFNSTFGILSFWWLANKAQDGRGSVTTSRLGDLMAIDPRVFSESELNHINEFFDDFKKKDLKDVFESDIDPHRKELDEFVVDCLLRAGSAAAEIKDGLATLRAKLVLEPSIAGGRQR